MKKTPGVMEEKPYQMSVSDRTKKGPPAVARAGAKLKTGVFGTHPYGGSEREGIKRLIGVVDALASSRDIRIENVLLGDVGALLACARTEE